MEKQRNGIAQLARIRKAAEHFHIALTIQAAKPVKADSPGKKSNKAKKESRKALFYTEIE